MSQIGYTSLFTQFSAERDDSTKKIWDEDKPETAFGRRFGFARLYERNNNLIETLTSPATALTNVNEALVKKLQDKAQTYQRYLSEYRSLGFPEEECVARADMLIGREVENELSLMQVKYPYALGGAAAGGWDPVTHLLQNSSIGEAPRTFKAISSTGGMGIGRGLGPSRAISKDEKKRLIRKGKRRARRKAGQ